ncbi:MAG TPA: hypothetical protein VFA89_00305 [Terriglobales bacterium]|nr:hypothetical protein [Terriglobales bacterium]
MIVFRTHRVLLMYAEMVLAAMILLLGAGLSPDAVPAILGPVPRGSSLQSGTTLNDPPPDTHCPADDLRKLSCEQRYTAVI